MRLTNIRPLGRYRNKKSGQMVNAKLGTILSRSIDLTFYLHKGDRIVINDLEFSLNWEKVEELPVSKLKYGVMPERQTQYAKIRGDAGVYEVWGFDWLNKRALINRAGEWVWMPIEKVQIIPNNQSEISEK